MLLTASRYALVYKRPCAATTPRVLSRRAYHPALTPGRPKNILLPPSEFDRNPAKGQTLGAFGSGNLNVTPESGVGLPEGAHPLEVLILGLVLACVAAVLLSGAAAVGFAVAEPTKSRVAAAASATRLSLGPLFLQALAATTGVTLRSLTLAVKALAPSFGTAMFALGGWLLRLLLRF